MDTTAVFTLAASSFCVALSPEGWAETHLSELLSLNSGTPPDSDSWAGRSRHKQSLVSHVCRVRTHDASWVCVRTEGQGGSIWACFL